MRFFLPSNIASFARESAGSTGWPGGLGFCGAGGKSVVSHYGPHFGEEPPISGVRGSGTIFFSPCNMRCVFCQNHQISQAHNG